MDRINIDIKDYNPFKDKGTTNNNFNFSTINSNTFDYNNYKYFNNLVNNKINNKSNNNVEILQIDTNSLNDVKTKYNNGSIVYQEYPSGKVKLDVILGWRLEFNEDGTIKKIFNNSSYLWSDKSLYKFDENGDIIIYDKDDENKIYMKLTKDGNKQELYSVEDYYKEIYDDFNYQFNVIRNNFSNSKVSSGIDNDDYKYIKCSCYNGDKYITICGRYNNNGDLCYIEYPNGEIVEIYDNHVLKKKDNSKLRYGSSEVILSEYSEEGLLNNIEFSNKEKINYSYFKNGKLKSYSHYDENKKIIERNEYYENGNLCEKENSKSIVKYYSNGNKKSVMAFNEEHSGRYEIGMWNENGTPIYEIDMLNKTSKNYNYFKNGNLKSIKLTRGDQYPYYKDEIESYYYYENNEPKAEYLSDGTHREWYENGILQYEKLSDGTEKRWSENGVLLYEKFIDGSSKSYNDNGNLLYYDDNLGNQIERRQYYKNGQLQWVRNSNNEDIEAYYENGQLKLKKLNDGSLEEYYENGQKRYEKLSDNSIEYYDENGKIYRIVNSDGKVIEENIYYTNGQLFYSKLKDGTEKKYYDDGRIEYIKNSLGEKIEEHNYDSNGKIYHEKFLDGSSKDYNTNGTIRYEVLVDGTKKYYDSNGKLLEVWDKDGNSIESYIYYSNGKISKEYKNNANGSILKYYNENGILEGEYYYDTNGNIIS